MAVLILSIGLFIALNITLFLLFKSLLFKARIHKRLFEGQKVLKLDKAIEVKLMIKKGTITRKGIISRLEKLLSEASIEMELSKFLKITVTFSILFPVLVYIFVRSWLIASLAFIVVPITFYLAVNFLKRKKTRLFNSQLPEIINFLSSSIRSGYSLMQGLSMIAAEGSPPASIEFKRVLQDINLGKSFEEAFDKMLVRNPIEELGIMVTAIIISRETGGNIGFILNTVAETIRERERINGEIKSLTAQGRLSGVILIVLPFVVFGLLFVLNPDYIRPLFKETIGRILLVTGICSQIIGTLVINKITKIDW